MTLEDLSLALTRVETKLDIAISGQTDHETRLRVLEGKGFVTSRQLVAALALVIPLIAAAIGVLVR